ncbi:putative disease resistance protein RGA4 [Carex rostrata]
MITTREEPHFNRNHKLAVIPIFGVGGVGKTVVAKKIYNNESVNEHFTLKAWVYVSECCDDKKILRDIILSFGDRLSSYTPMNLEYLGRMLKMTIKNERFLLILDNLRDMTELKWNDLKSLLCFGEVGSVVVVTTQSRIIANTIRTLPVVTLECLDTKSFWELFEYFAFGGLKLGDLKDQPPLSPSKHDDLKKIGKQIADKLHGLPLAGEFIGTLLSKRLEREFWEDIRRSNWWNIEGARKNILPSIGVGYNYLDPDLKQCFVFCSIFPKLYVFQRKRLVQMWIAQGFIQPSKEETYLLDKGEKRIEDIGEKRFDELVDRSFFQPTLRDGEYLMHDLVRDLAIAVSSNEFCFVKSHDKHLPSLARHLGIDCDNLEVEWKCKDSARLRTMILFGNWTKCSAESIGNIFAKYNRLRVLDVSYIELKTNEPINVASQLSHLRFVDLSFTGIKSIPDEFCALCHLEVLDVRGCKFEKLPERMNRLISLRHFYASSDTISLISGIGKLTKLQELEEFCIEDSERPVINKGHKISELMHMNELRGHLVLSNLKAVPSKEEAVKSQLDKKIYLKSLTLINDYEEMPGTKVNMEVLDALKPARSLETLEVYGCRWKSFPDWVFSPHHGFNNLKDISVKSYWLRNLPAFGELPFLELLCFDSLPLIEKVGGEFYGRSDVVFPSLKELKFRVMDSWTHWSNGEARKMIFPRLKKLHLEFCKLKELPTDSSISSVVELKLHNCYDLRNIGEVLQGMPSLSHLIITQAHVEFLSIYSTPLNSLEVMHLEGIKKLCLVEGLKSLINLRKLVIKYFNEILESYEVEQENDQISQEENEEQCLQFLTYLHLCHNCGSTQSLPRVGRLSSLRTLLIEWSPAAEYTTGEESWFIQLTSLEKLEFRCCILKCLPSTLWLLTSLKKLHIDDCPQMLSLPENGLPKNLAELYIDECPYLIDRCQPTEGDDWHKISHIPFVRLDGNTYL